MDYAIEMKFQALKKKMAIDFDGDVDIQGILFLIGVQELGKGYAIYTKKEKTELLHVAVCAVLEPYGYYRFDGRDADDWPHFETLKALPNLDHQEQQHLLKEAILEYFKTEGYFESDEIKP